MFRGSDSASPCGFNVSSWGTCTSTFTPVGVLPAVPSGATLIEGVNGSRLQPSSACVWALGSGVGKTMLPGSSHESASTLVCSGPVHEVGNDKNAGGLACACSLHAPTSAGLNKLHRPRVTHSQPRA